MSGVSSRRSGWLSSYVVQPFAFAIGANMTCVGRDAGRMATDMLTHFPVRFSIILTLIVPLLNAADIWTCILRRLSSKIRNDVVLEWRRMPRHRCILDCFRSHLVSDKN